MPWVKFWSSANSHDRDNEQYEWHDTTLSEDLLHDEARERVPSWLLMSEQFYYGHDIVDCLPDNVRKNLIATYKRQKENAEKMIKLLEITDIMEG